MIFCHVFEEIRQFFYMPNKTTAEKRRIFAVGYGATYIGGEIKLGKNHEKYEWVDIGAFKPEDYFTGGWLSGVKEFQAQYKK